MPGMLKAQIKSSPTEALKIKIVRFFVVYTNYAKQVSSMYNKLKELLWKGDLPKFFKAFPW